MHKEKRIATMSGWGMLFAILALLGGSVWALVWAIGHGSLGVLWPAIFGLVLGFFLLPGLFVINPNEAVVILLAGDYKGTSRQIGLRYANPFFTKRKISLKARNLNGDRLKVNDLSGNPIEIAAVVVWRVSDTAEALFEVDDYETYVTIQSESAVRHLAGAYPYDGDDSELTLRGTTDAISDHLQKELQERLDKAGVTVIEARLSHLAYAPEIAHAMLQRQQASAVVAARTKIVEGAVGMVEMALKELGDKDLVNFDEDRKAVMISNLLVVLCSEHAAQPVINTGTLHQ
ncbi:MAG: SPFH domain-containing protein [Krumholzibacteria bacterium]|nr:SPFH domain-containing protein [Candidatus Krumholzibacteria bacterium]